MQTSKKLEIACLLAIILILLQPTLTFTMSVRADPSVVIVSHTGFIAFNEFFVITGEVENVGTTPLRHVTLTATFRDLNNEVIDTIEEKVSLEVLLVGRKSPFNIILLDKTKSAQVDTYDLTIKSYEPYPAGKRKSLKILWDLGFNYTISGEINNKNETEAKATGVKILATFYDEQNQVIAVEADFILELQWGETAAFEIRFPYPDKKHLISHWMLTAESVEFAVEAEVTHLPKQPESDNPFHIYLFYFLLIALPVIFAIGYLRLRKRRQRKLRRKRRTPSGQLRS